MKTRRELLEEFVERLRFAAGADLESVILYGSAARNAFRDEISDINLLCTLKALSRETMAKLASPIQWWSVEHGERAPLIFTSTELQTSSDVFSIELMDIKSSHRVLFGEDAVRELEVPLNLHRIELEHELRTLLLKLRHHYLLSYGNDVELRAIMAKSISGALTLLRHAVFAVEGTMPGSNPDAISQASRLLGLDESALHNVVSLRDNENEKLNLARLIDIYQVYVNAIVKAIDKVDQLAPTEQWQRVR